MNSENFHVDTASADKDLVADNNDAKLLKFDENNTVSPGKDINTKITALDTDLAQLRMELGTISNSVEEGLDRLGDTDTDLTAKVSETYKRLGEIDNAYKSLLEISSRIDRDVQKLNGDVNTVAEQSASGIKNLEQSNVAQSHEFTQKNQQVASKVNQLVETSKLSSELLAQKIQSTTDVMLQIEKRVVAEIDSLSNATKDKTDSIENSIDSNKAKILKLQSIDEAIIRRATTLEISSAELTVASQRIEASVEQLELSSDVLAHGIDKLKQRTTELETLTGGHGTLIAALQKATSDITDKVVALAGRERKHFTILSAGFLLLVVAVAVIYFVQQKQFGVNDVMQAERSGVVDGQITSLQQMQQDSAITISDSFAVLESKIEQVSATLQDEIKNEIAQVDDKVQSVAGRLNHASPFSQVGDDNIIHGSQWIADLPQQNYTVQLAYADTKDGLYEIALRYNYQLKDSLSYFTVSENGGDKYVLLSGNYATRQQAVSALDSMPGYINRQQPVIRKIETIQQYIAVD